MMHPLDPLFIALIYGAGLLTGLIATIVIGVTLANLNHNDGHFGDRASRRDWR